VWIFLFLVVSSRFIKIVAVSPFFQWCIIAMGNNLQCQKINQFSPIEPLMIDEPIIGVFLSIDMVLKALAEPKIG
jgi:hypothetical protein